MRCLILAIWLSVISFGAFGAQSQSPKEKQYWWSAKLLERILSNNELDYERRFLRKRINLFGEVASVGTFLGGVTVTLKGNTFDVPSAALGLNKKNTKSINIAAKLNPGETIYAKCVTSRAIFIAVFTDCSIDLKM